ncbi:oxaloacetate decarboxylase [Georgenia sp. AZ-5]|uniref:isocitrate lyase/PEP mutase family protein n=1 Tax=Georgenia sp. AZ-5 TaxID=3367526 RepID=UPI003754B46B
MSTLRARLKEGGVVAPGAHDALTAVLARRAGFNTIYVSGFAFEATQLAAPDMGMATMTELAAHVSHIDSAAGVEVICDVDTGFGGPNSLHRTVRELERSGAAAIQIEDQAEPKRCPFVGGRQVVDRDTAVARIRIAAESRQSDMLIIARTDADEISTDEVVERCRLFAAAGADLVLPMVRNLDGRPITDRTPSERMRICEDLVERIGHPVVTLDPPAGHTAQDLFDIGVSLVIMPLASLEAATTAVVEYFDSLRDTGSSEAHTTAYPPRLAANLDMMNALGLAEYLERDEAMPRR